ncbi:MAG: dynamin family protein [Moraxellaceae bacterium]
MSLMPLCLEAEGVFQKSPLRLHPDLLEMLDAVVEIENNIKRLDKIKSDLELVLKVFLIGEVKAGKSTLINAIIGQQVAPTNILEATAAIWEFGFSPESSTTICYTDGSSQEIEHSLIMSFLGTDEKQLTFAQKIEKISVMTDTHDFKNLLLVDSPGLSTVTTQNAELTKKIMQDVDLALWVLNANHLGQIDVMQEVESLSKLGKPIIAVINKIDEVDEPPERLIRYLRRHSEEYFEGIFAISAYDKINETNEYSNYFDNLMEYLTDQVDQKSKQVKFDSSHSSLIALMRSEQMTHQSSLRKIKNRQQERLDYSSDLDFEKSKIIGYVDDFIADKAIGLSSSHTLFLKAKAAVSPAHKNMASEAINVLSKKNEDSSEEIESRANSISVLEQEVLEAMNLEVRDFYKTRCSDSIEVLGKKSVERMHNFNEKERVLISSQQLMLLADSGTVDAIETAKTAAVVSVAGGVAAAGYTAVVGASAASITMGTALAAVALPVALVGAAGGLAYGVWKSRQNNEKIEQQARAVQVQMAERVKNTLQTSYLRHIEQDFKVIQAENEKFLFLGMNKSTIRDYENEIEDYISKVDILLSSYPKIS